MKPFFLIYFFLLSTCSFTQKAETGVGKETASDPGKILIVYLSRTNNTKTIAGIIQQKVGGTLVAIELQQPYPDDYETTVDQVARENATGYLPPLKTSIKNIEDYDVVFIGFPTWGMQLPPPMKSFLTNYDLSGKTVAPFNTNAGYGVGSGFKTVKELCKNCKVLEGFEIKGGVERDGIYLAIKGQRKKEAEEKVVKWLKAVKMM